MLPDEVRKAVERMDACIEITKPQHTVFCGDKDTYLTIRAHLLAREAEVEGMRTLLDLLRTDNNGKKYHCIVSRAGSVVPVEEIIAGTAHLSENSRG